MEHRAMVAAWVVLGLLAAGCGSDDGRAAPPTTVAATVAPATTSPLATTSSTTSTSSTTTSSTSTTGPIFPTSTSPLVEFAESCIEHPAAREAPTYDETRLDSFGPLGVAPAIEFPMPDGPPQPEGVASQTNVGVTRIPGGMLVQASAGGGNAERVLTAIDHDGTVRWQRCFDGGYGFVIAADASTGPTEALLYDDMDFAGTSIGATTVFSLADGRDTRPLTDVIATTDWPASAEPLTNVGDVLGGQGRRLVLLTPSGERAPVSTDPVAVLDLVEMTISTVPFPPEPEFDVSYPGFVKIDDQDRLVRIDSPTSGASRATAVFLDGDWVTDPQMLTEEFPITVSAWVEETPVPGLNPLTALNAHGDVVWTRDDLLIPDGEGFWFGVVDDVLLAVTCVRHTTIDGYTQCDELRTGAYDVTTGTAIWERAGYHASAIIGDGYVLAPRQNGGWEMLDLRTGERAHDDQVWDEPFAFSTECCGGDTTQRAELHGGIVLTVSEGMVRIYLPPWASHPTVSLELI